jgi:hypothetical protein
MHDLIMKNVVLSIVHSSESLSRNFDSGVYFVNQTIDSIHFVLIYVALILAYLTET